MIIDKLENLKNYASVNPLFPKVVEFLQQNDPLATPSATHCLRQSTMPRRTSPRFQIWLQTAILHASRA